MNDATETPLDRVPLSMLFGPKASSPSPEPTPAPSVRFPMPELTGMTQLELPAIPGLYPQEQSNPKIESHSAPTAEADHPPAPQPRWVKEALWSLVQPTRKKGTILAATSGVTLGAVILNAFFSGSGRGPAVPPQKADNTVARAQVDTPPSGLPTAPVEPVAKAPEAAKTFMPIPTITESKEPPANSFIPIPAPPVTSTNRPAAPDLNSLGIPNIEVTPKVETNLPSQPLVIPSPSIPGLDNQPKEIKAPAFTGVNPEEFKIGNNVIPASLAEPQAGAPAIPNVPANSPGIPLISTTAPAAPPPAIPSIPVGGNTPVTPTSGPTIPDIKPAPAPGVPKVEPVLPVPAPTLPSSPVKVEPVGQPGPLTIPKTETPSGTSETAKPLAGTSTEIPAVKPAPDAPAPLSIGNLNATPSPSAPSPFKEEKAIEIAPFGGAAGGNANLTLTKPAGNNSIQPVSSEPPRTGYDVDLHQPKPGDTYASICKRYYYVEDGERYAAALQEFNNRQPLGQVIDVRVPPMSILKLRYPQLIGAPRTVSTGGRDAGTGTNWNPTNKPAQPETYLVSREGLTMHDIADELYGDFRKWKNISDANPRLDPNKLPKGIKLELPVGLAIKKPAPRESGN
jgi:hypothetical protein